MLDNTGNEAARVTPCELGAIFHRPNTVLLPPRRCGRGHVALRYSQHGDCTVCAKLRGVENYAKKAAPDRRPRRRYTDYAAAAAYHEEVGGYLLDLGRYYLVTDSELAVARYRSCGFLRRCYGLQCWDEVALSRRQRPGH